MDRSSVSERLTKLLAAERALLRARLGEKELGSGANWSIPRRQAGDSAPLSFAQQRLWFLDQFEPNSSLYVVYTGMRMSGELDVAALQRALETIVNRHEILRTTFMSIDGNPTQVIAPAHAIELPVVDLENFPNAEREKEAQCRAREEALRPFRLYSDRMLRAKLFRLASHEHVLVLTMHHIVSDGWSLGVLFRELSIWYEAFSKGRPAALSELPIQYADYAIWQREWLRGEVLESQLSYWKKQLDGLPTLQLPSDCPRPVAQSYRGARQSLVLAKDLAEKLKVLSRKEGVTLFMTLLAGFQSLLYRYSGQEDIAVGSPIAGRTRRELEDLIGFFVNTLVLRADLSGNPTFRELLARVREAALAAYDHQDVPFEKLVEELHPERDLSRSPLFQVMFVLQNAPSSPPQFSGVTVSPMTLDGEVAKFDLSLAMYDEAAGLRASLQYSTDLFDAATITRMLGHFEILLQSIVSTPNQRLLELPILTETETHQLLIEWNKTETDYPRDQCLHHLFEAQVERSPDAIAVVFENDGLTYRELNRRANQLAHHLRKLGVGPDMLVGLCMERSLGMVVALLGVLKAGGAYVPLDPEYPKERLAFMLEDARATVLLTQQQLIENLPEHGARVVCLETGSQSEVQESEENPLSGVTAENLAYVIYTSGSTGRPKGVMISHRAICNHMFWMQDQFPLAEDDRVVQKTPFSFDASVWEFYAPLIAGARLIMARPEAHRDCAYLIGLIAREQVSVLQLVPSLLQLLLEEKESEICKRLTRVFCGGEPISRDLAERFLARLGVDLHNLYGPTEASIDATFWTCRLESSQRSVPIGRPISNMQSYVLDSHLQPVPIGVAGELHLGGAGLARGYWNRPDLSHEKFIPNPFSSEPGTRLYKTGDMARYRPDGEIEFLGRIDNQVKVRGFRVELGEIETVLAQHPTVREAIVVAREETNTPENRKSKTRAELSRSIENPKSTKRLVAYIVSSHDPVEISDLRNFLANKLPGYMIPSAFVFLDSLPLTPNGKIDRRALPAPGSDRSDLERTYVAPRTPVEEAVAAIWGEVLDLDRVGIHDNFFDVGGHSLLATQVISRIHDAFHGDLPLRALFENPTVASLAVQISRIQSSETGAEELGKILADLESLSDEEAQDLVSRASRDEPV